MYLDTAATKFFINQPIWMSCMAEALKGVGNPSSLHSAGEKARKLIETARKRIALSINAKPEQILFFPSATAANHAVSLYAPWNTSGIEHSSMDFTNNLVPNISHILISNITGELYDIKSIRDKCEGLFHTDVSAAYSKTDIDVKALNVDFMTFPSSHKLGLMGGCCPLYVKDVQKFTNSVSKLFKGGKQEGGVSRGTENVLAIHAYGVYASNIPYEIRRNKKYNNDINEWLDEELSYYHKKGENFVIRGRFKEDTFSSIGDSNIALLAFKNVDAETLQYLLSEKHDIQVSTLSACSSGSIDGRIINKLSVPVVYQYGTIRVSWDYEYKRGDVIEALEKIISVGEHLSKMN